LSWGQSTAGTRLGRAEYEASTDALDDDGGTTSTILDLIGAEDEAGDTTTLELIGTKDDVGPAA
jgi:hypothetical protein